MKVSHLPDFAQTFPPRHPPPQLQYHTLNVGGPRSHFLHAWPFAVFAAVALSFPYRCACRECSWDQASQARMMAIAGQVGTKQLQKMPSKKYLLLLRASRLIGREFVSSARPGQVAPFHLNRTCAFRDRSSPNRLSIRQQSCPCRCLQDDHVPLALQQCSRCKTVQYSTVCYPSNHATRLETRAHPEETGGQSLSAWSIMSPAGVAQIMRLWMLDSLQPPTLRLQPEAWARRMRQASMWQNSNTAPGPGTLS